jgi:NADH pyrophosphatase NudC (nudix superfamily)
MLQRGDLGDLKRERLRFGGRCGAQHKTKHAGREAACAKPGQSVIKGFRHDDKVTRTGAKINPIYRC